MAGPDEVETLCGINFILLIAIFLLVAITFILKIFEQLERRRRQEDPPEGIVRQRQIEFQPRMP